MTKRRKPNDLKNNQKSYAYVESLRNSSNGKPNYSGYSAGANAGMKPKDMSSVPNQVSNGQVPQRPRMINPMQNPNTIQQSPIAPTEIGVNKNNLTPQQMDTLRRLLNGVN